MWLYNTVETIKRHATISEVLQRNDANRTVFAMRQYVYLSGGIGTPACVAK